ncbi:MAG TPA: DNA repair protein RadC [Fimbriimonadaceae bacterium]|nr:DNA repair protein RadC [Fimbriimonadaceae bacterium]
MIRETDDGPLIRLARLGITSLGAADLVAIVRAASADDVQDEREFAREWLRTHRLGQLRTMSPADMKELAGLEGHEATRALALLELGRRAGAAAHGEFTQYEKADDVFRHMGFLREARQEQFWVVFLNAKNGVLAYKEIHRGTVNMSVVGPREVFGEAYRLGAVAIVAVHNHPSGDPTPSPEDIEITHKLAEIGELLEVALLDHVIIGHHRSVSLKAMGVL